MTYIISNCIGKQDGWKGLEGPFRKDLSSPFQIRSGGLAIVGQTEFILRCFMSNDMMVEYP